jgi:UDP-N-acetylglucosamine transferase subunit ALG13
MTTLLVASTGGHLKELTRLAPRLRGHDGDLLWVTNDSTQSRSLLRGWDPVYVPYQHPRDILAATANARRAWKILQSTRATTVVSTGSGIALAFLPTARLLGIDAHYIESCARVTSPSLTGRILQSVPGVRCYTQSTAWEGPRWRYEGSVFDGFAMEPSAARPDIRKVVVTLGTWTRGFRRLIERLLAVLPPDAETVWQTGATDVSGLPIRPVRWLDPTQFTAALREADLVVSHAGAGSTLDALEAGKCPVLVPRRKANGEAVDDHQVELADHLAGQGLALTASPEDLRVEVLRQAASRRVVRGTAVSDFQLVSQ